MSDATPWPAVDPRRLADAVAELAERVVEPEVRAQLHALAGIVRNLVVPVDEARPALARELEQGRVPLVVWRAKDRGGNQP